MSLSFRALLVVASFLVSRADVSPSLNVKLNDGLMFPSVSFGLQVYGDDKAESLTNVALKAGIRNFFSSVLANNQKGFGRAIANTSVPRKDIFICGSVDTGGCSGKASCKAETADGCEANLRDIGVKKLDMIMLDYPANDCDSIQGQWAAFEDMMKAGKTRSIAVSNFSPSQLDCLAKAKMSVPTVNQLQYNVLSHDTSIADDASRGGVIVQAYSPLGSGSVLGNTVVKGIASKHNKTSAQVALRWILQVGATFTTSASSLAHFQQDLDLFDFALSDNEMKTLTALGQSQFIAVHG